MKSPYKLINLVKLGLKTTATASQMHQQSKVQRAQQSSILVMLCADDDIIHLSLCLFPIPPILTFLVPAFPSLLSLGRIRCILKFMRARRNIVNFTMKWEQKGDYSLGMERL